MVPENYIIGYSYVIYTAKMSNFKDNDKIHYYQVRIKCESAISAGLREKLSSCRSGTQNGLPIPTQMVSADTTVSTAK